MNQKLRRTCCAAALVSSLLVPSASAEIDRYRSQGSGAEAYIYEVDSTGCVVTEIWLFVREGSLRIGSGPGERSTRVEFAGHDYDQCQDYYLSSFHIFTTVPAQAFHTSGLNSASLQATIPVEVSWGVTVPFTFDLLWTANDDSTARSFEIQRHRHPGFTYMSRTSGRGRDAVLSGSIVWGTRNLLSGLIYGSMSVQQSSVTTIRRDPAAALAASPLAPSLAGPETESYSSRGNGAIAHFSDATGCVRTETALYVKEGRTQSEPGPAETSTSIDFFSYDYDACKGRYTAVRSGFAAVPADTVRFQGQGLQSASLRVTIQVENRAAGGIVTTVPVSFDLVWTGEGEVSRGHAVYQNGHQGFSYRTRSSGSSRDATVSGSILFESRDLAASPETSASLEYHQSAVTTRSVRRQP